MQNFGRQLLEHLNEQQKYKSIEELKRDLQNYKDNSSKMRLLTFVWYDIRNLVKLNEPSIEQLAYMDLGKHEKWREMMEYELICGFFKGISYIVKKDYSFENLVQAKKTFLTIIRKSSSTKRRAVRKSGFRHWDDRPYDELHLKNMAVEQYEVDSFEDIHRLLISYLQTLDKCNQMIFVNFIGKGWYEGDDADHYLSAEELSKQLKKSEVQIYYAINRLRAEFRSILVENRLLA